MLEEFLLIQGGSAFQSDFQMIRWGPFTSGRPNWVAQSMDLNVKLIQNHPEYCLTMYVGIPWPSYTYTYESESESRSVVSNSLQPHGLYSPWNSLGQNTEVGSLSLLQGIFQTQGSNPGLLDCRQILSQMSHKGRPRILEWVAYPFSSGSSQPRNRTRVSCISGGFFTNWAIREAPLPS